VGVPNVGGWLLAIEEFLATEPAAKLLDNDDIELLLVILETDGRLDIPDPSRLRGAMEFAVRNRLLFSEEENSFMTEGFISLERFEGESKSAVRDYIASGGEFPTNKTNVEIIAELISRRGQNTPVDKDVVADTVKFCTDRGLFVPQHSAVKG